MKRFIKYLLISIFIILVLFGTKVLAEENPFSRDGNNLKYNNGSSSQVLNFKTFLDLLAKDNTDSGKIIREKFLQVESSDLKGANLNFVNCNYLLDYRRQLCLDHYTGDSLNHNYHYQISDVLDIGYDADLKCFTIVNADGKILKASINDSLKSKIIRLSSMIYLNGTYSKEGQSYYWSSTGKYGRSPLIELLTAAWHQLGNDDNAEGYINTRFIDQVYLNPEMFNNDYTWSVLGNNADEIREKFNNMVDSYQKYKQLTKTNVKNNGETIQAQENICSVTKPEENYTTVGPFCLNFNEENGIEKITVKNVETETKIDITDDVYIYIEKEGAEKDFKKISERAIEPGKTFYLAINNDKLPDVGKNYNVIFTQKALKYYKTRIVLLESMRQQQLGTFIEDRNETSYSGEVEYTIEHISTGKKIIVKKWGKRYDTNTSYALEGVKLKVYGIVGNNKGWVKANGDNITTLSSFEDATTYETNNIGIANIERLNEEGIYYVYETATAEGYDLETQRERYPDGRENYPAGFEPEQNVLSRCVFLGTTSGLEKWDQYSMIKYQYPSTRLTVEKIDSKDKIVPGVVLKIYAILDDGTQGWIGNDGQDLRIFRQANSWTTDENNGRINIDNVSKGKYYIYEIEAGNGFELEEQRNHYPNEAEPEEIGFKVAGKSNYDNAVYLGKIEIESDGEENDSFIYQYIQQFEQFDDEPAKLTVRKVDYYDNTKVLNGVEFAIFVGDSGWLGYDGNTVTYEKSWGDAYKFKTGSSYCGEDQIEGEFTLNGLAYGDYYVIETSVGENDKYELSEQVGYSYNSDYEFLTEDRWKMKTNGTPVESVLIGSESYNQKYTSVIKSNGTIYNFIRNRQDEQVDYIHLDWYKNRIWSESRGSYNYGTNHATYTILNKPVPDLTLIKKDEDTGEKLDGAEFYIEVISTAVEEEENNVVVYYLKPQLTDNGDLVAAYKKHNLTNESTEEEKENFKADRAIKVENGEMTIKGLEDGMYIIREVKAPNGYSIESQENYDDTNKWVSCGTILIENGEVKRYIGDNEKFSYNNGKYELTVENEGLVNIKGYVWVDEPDTKGNATDNVYRSGTNDYIYKDGIKVNLYKYDENEPIATTTTYTERDHSSDSSKEVGHYEFIEQVSEADLPNCYVEFEYDNTKYVCVDTFVGADDTINSKAKEETIEVEELNDNNLTGVSAPHPGRAITSPKEDSAAHHKFNVMLNSETRTVENVNLGLMKKLEPEFSITEDIAYMKVQFGGDIYRYKYMEDDEQLKRTTAPTVNEQVSKRTFTGKIYPSDVAYNMATDTETLKVYVVYRINVFNNTSNNIENNYIEEKMYVESLTNTYDSSKYKLSTDSNDKVDSEDAKKDFDLWTVSGDTASYNCNNTWRDKYKNGVKTEFDGNGNIIEGREGYVTTYIQFQLTEDFVEKILKKHLTEGDLEEAPSTATAVTFHEYLRSDNVWKSGNEKYYEGHKQQSYNVGTTRYLHKSLNQTATTSELGMKFGLPENERTISGVVFEDTITAENKAAKKALGNGLKETNENTVSNVRVELLNSKNSDEPVTLYQNSTSSNANYQTQLAIEDVEEGGKFEFKGVIPGTYYIRFTYGDGTQRLYDTSGNIVKEKVKAEDGNEINKEVEVKLSDYKSTIIDANTRDGQTIKAAMEAADNDNSHIQWYKDINGKNYSTAVDDLTERSETDGSVYYKDGKAYDNSGNEKTTRTSVHAFTPKFLVTLENDKDTSSDAVNYTDNGLASKKNSNYYDFTGFNFGIIKAPDITIDTEKIIKNVRIQNQVGTNLVNADPTDKTASYISSIEEVNGRSVNSRIEIEPNQIYSSELIATYEVTLKNNSKYTDYVEDDQNYGYYYKYGITEFAHEKQVKAEEVMDVLDTDYKYSLLPKELTQTKTDSKGEQTISEEKITVTPGKTDIKIDASTNKIVDISGEVKEVGTEVIRFNNWSGIAKGESVSITYDASSQLSPDGENLFVNNVEITKISLEKLTTLTTGSKWYEIKNTEITIYGPTGENRSYDMILLPGAILLIMGVGIVLIKKYVL